MAGIYESAQIGIRQDIADIVANVRADQMPFTSMIRKRPRPLQKLTQWQMEDYPATPHAAGSVDPLRDARTMEDELILADLAVVEKRLDRLEKGRQDAGDSRLLLQFGKNLALGDPALLRPDPGERLLRPGRPPGAGGPPRTP